MEELAIKIEHVSKQYRLGAIGGGTLKGDLQSWWARKRGREDPNSKIGERTDVKIGELFLALDDVSIEVKKGEALGIIGHNGAGKSTLLKLLSRVTAPTTGTISYNGRITSMLEVGTGFHQELTGRENVYMNGAILGMTKKEIDAKIEQIIDFSEVRQFIDTPVKRYSSGMYVKLAFSVAAHLDSEIMVMDEVLAVGDMAFQRKCLTKMREAADQEGRTVLYVSHNMNTIRQLCDRVIVLDHGKVVYSGSVEGGIEKYLGIQKEASFPSFYDLKAVQRHYGFGESIFINSFRFLEKEDPVYLPEEPMKFEIELDPKVDADHLRLILAVKDSNYIKVGMAMSVEFSVCRGEIRTLRFSLDISALAPGVYCLDMAPIFIHENKDFFTFDDPGENILFEIEESPDDQIVWHKEYWGDLSLPTIRLLD